MNKKVSIFWFRRDLRLEDNAALYYALRDGAPVQPVFMFDKEILDRLEDRDDARVTFIYREIVRLSAELEQKGAYLDVRYGTPLRIWKELEQDYDILNIYANRDYEPYARQRDKEVYEYFSSKGIEFISKKDQVIFEKNEVVKTDGEPYKVFTPYSNTWREKLNDFYLKPYPTLKYPNWHQSSGKELITLKEMGFVESKVPFPDRELDKEAVKDYHKSRDTPGIRGTTRMSVHLRFGTVSIRDLVAKAKELNAQYLTELIWREFYMAILWHFPKVTDHNFKSKYDRIPWRNNETEFQKWCNGETGYPIVDAGMRELNETGFMHNRVRMITASFLTKHLLVDWRWGEAYFARKLLDFELSSNNGGWQWAAGTGVDAQPYFRVFNPTSQMEKFDKDRTYVKKWVPEYKDSSYQPMVEHKMARERAIETFKENLNV